MECRKYQEHITAAIDNALPSDELASLETHLAHCPYCRTELEIEKAMRHFVQARCKLTKTPAHVLHAITQHIENATANAEESVPLWRRLVSSFYFRPAIAFAVAGLAVLLLFTTDRSPNIPRTIEASLLPANDVIKQSLTNYMAVVRGEIKPQLVTDKVEHVQQFFAGKTDFPVLFPNIQGCKLIGAVLNNFSGKTLAHVVYAHHGSELVYIYEACWQTVESGETLQLARDVQHELGTSGRYVLSQPDGYTIVLWRKDSTLCSAVARLDEETLLACLNLAP